MAKKKQEETEEQEGKKKGGLLKWIIILILLLGLAGGGYFAYMKFFANPDKAQSEEIANETSESENENTEEEGSTDPAKQPEMISLPSFVVNLADPLGRRYLKMSIDVEVMNKSAGDALQKAMPRVKDALLLLLSSKSYSSLASMESKLQLKTEIVARLNQLLNKKQILNVYFTEFVIQ